MSLALPELQRAFLASIWGEDAASLRGLVVENGLSTEARFRIYRNNVANNLRNALKADYPVVERLVGDDFFGYAVRTYASAVPSRSGDVNDYGEDFPEFLATFPDSAGLPYLGDVASLERAWRRCFTAADGAAADLSGLMDLPPDRLGDLCFGPHPALQMQSSPYPVLRIWRANQPGVDAAEIRLDEGGDRIVLCRSGDDVEMIAVTPAEYAWLAALRGGSCLSQAVEAAFVIDENFALESCLRRCLDARIFIGYLLRGKQ